MSAKKLIAILMAVVSLMCGGISAMADSHNWDSGKWLRLPTCKVTGLKLLQCTNDGCNATTKVTVARVDHVYLAATCTKAERCQWCDTTKKGSKPLGHKKPEVGCIDQPCDRKDCDVIVVKRKAGMHHYQGATCESPAICALCGIDDATPLGHNFTEATCNAPATCTRCKKTEGNKKTHSYFPATCTQLATCRHCGETTGTYKDHNFQNGKCTVCNKPQYALDDEPNEEDDLMVLAAQ